MEFKVYREMEDVEEPMAKADHGSNRTLRPKRGEQTGLDTLESTP